MENCSNCRFSGNRSVVTTNGVRSEIERCQERPLPPLSQTVDIPQLHL